MARHRRRRAPTPGSVQDVLLMHEVLLSDARRQRAFRRALRAVVRPGCAVLDVGSGTGVWALLAAKLGAAEVVALEREPVLLPVIERLARENGVADRVRVVGRDSRRARLGRRFDVVVAELIGHQGFDEQIVPVMADARRRFLRPGGRVVPQAIALFAAPARLRDRTGLRATGVHLGALRELTVHLPRVVYGGSVQTLAPPVRLRQVDLRRAEADAGRGELCGRFAVDDLRRVEGLAVWVEVTLAPGVTLSTRSGTHWSPTFFPVEPLGEGPGRLTCRIRMDGRPWWEVRVTSAGRRRTSRHSPVFAYGSLLPAIPRRVRRAGRKGIAIRSAG